MTLTILSWLTGSRLGRQVALALLVVVLVLLVLWRVYVAGKRSTEITSHGDRDWETT